MTSPLGTPQAAELARIQERLRAFFERALLPAELPRSEGLPGAWRPAADLVDTGAAYRLQLEVPGAGREDLDLTFEGSALVVSGRLSPPVEEPGFLRMERRYGSFRRSFQLEVPVDPDAIEARLENGLLTVHIPKRRPRHVVDIRSLEDEPEHPDDPEAGGDP